MLTLLKYDRLYVLFLIPFIITGIWLSNFIHPGFVEYSFNSNPMPLYKLLITIVNPHSVFASILAMILIALNSVLLIRMNGVNQLTTKGTYLHGILFIIIASVFHDIRQLNPVLFSTVFLLFAANKLFHTYKIRNDLRPFFEAGFLIGVASLFYFNCVFFIVLIFISLLLFQRVNWREYLAPILGLLSVFLFTFTWYFVFDRIDTFYEALSKSLSGNSEHNFLHISNYIFFGYTGFLFIISIFLSYSGIIKKIHTRKIYSYFLIWFIIGLGVFFIVPGIGPEAIILLAIPLSVFLTNYLLSIYSIALSEIVFLTFIALYILAQFDLSKYI